MELDFFANRVISQSPWLPTDDTSDQEKLLLSYIIPRVSIQEYDTVIKVIQGISIFEAQFQINNLEMF